MTYSTSNKQKSGFSQTISAGLATLKSKRVLAMDADFKEDDHKRDDGGKFTDGGGGGGESHAQSLSSRRDAVSSAMKDIADGAAEATVPGLRDDLEQYGGTNDVTIVRGDSKKGLVHIAGRHGEEVIPGVLEAVVDGKVDRFSQVKKTVSVQKDGYEAILSLDEHGSKKTWLLTGYNLTGGKGASDERGKVCTSSAPTQSGPTFGRPALGADAALKISIAKIMEKSILTRPLIVFDSATQRHKDDNGFLHVAAPHISKETVNPYYGREIPGWESLGLDPEQIYQGYRSGEELEKGAKTFNGLPLLRGHHVEHAEAPQTQHRVGSLGTDAAWNSPYLDNSLIVTDGEAIRKIENGERVELSAAYAYDPVFTPGEFEGQRYDFVMTNIRGNHVALVEEGRAGPDVIVADEKPKGVMETMWKPLKQALSRAKRNLLAMDADPAAIEKAETAIEEAALAIQAVEAAENGTEKEEVGLDEDKDAKIKEILESFPDLAPEQAEALSAALNELAYSKATGDEEIEDDTMVADSDPARPDDGMKKAMDACGLDSENPDAQKAFAEGVKYGERKEKEEPQKLDREHESEGAKKAMDAALKTKRGILSDLRSMQAAVEDCRPLVGAMDMMAFDSAEAIYQHACKLAGQSNVPRSAARAVVQALKAQSTPMVAMDAKSAGYKPRFA